MKKKIAIVSIVAIMTLLFASIAYAEMPNFSVVATPPGTAQTTANNILGFIRWVGYAVAVGMLIYIGIKYIMASADEKANLKNSLIRYVIGAILISGAVTIADWVMNIATGK